MKREIRLQNKKVTYTLNKSKRARRMRLTVRRDGAVTVTIPFDLQESVAEKFMKEKNKWLLSKIAYFKQFEGHTIARYDRKDFLKHKNKAYEFAWRKLNHFNKVYKFRFNNIYIKNQKTRWGSCSEKGNLNFNYKIILLPEHVADYIIVHELCHLKELNHSKKFWNLVEKSLPDYLKIKEELKQDGIKLS